MRRLLLREPLRRRPYGERTIALSHGPRRSRPSVVAPRYVTSVSRRPVERPR